MDFEYGCAITNKYSFLDENEVEDPSELLAHVSEPKGKQAKETSSAKSNKLTSTTKSTSNNKQQQSKDVKKQPLQQQIDNSVKSSNKLASNDDSKKQRNNQKQGGQLQPQQPKEDKENSSNKNDRRVGSNPTGFKGDRRENNDNQRPPRRSGPRPEGGSNNQDRPRRFREFGNDNVQNEDGEVSDNAGFRRGPGSNTGVGFRGPRGQGFRNRRTNDSEKHREFDRHSGSEKTGVKHIDKKDGAGKGNWGTPEDELAAQDNLNDTQGEQTENNWAARVDESEEAKRDEDGGDENKDVHPNFMTLDEYKALRNEINKKNEFNIRQPGEGEDQSKWPKTYLLAKKKDEEENEDEDEEEEEEDEEDTEEDKKKSLVNQIQIRFYEPPSSGRRGERRGGDRRGPRPPRPVQSGESGPTVNEIEQPVEPSEVKERNNNRPRNNNNQRGGQRRSGPFRGSNQQRVNVPRIEDEKDFPSLGK